MRISWVCSLFLAASCAFAQDPLLGKRIDKYLLDQGYVREPGVIPYTLVDDGSGPRLLEWNVANIEQPTVLPSDADLGIVDVPPQYVKLTEQGAVEMTDAEKKATDDAIRAAVSDYDKWEDPRMRAVAAAVVELIGVTPEVGKAMIAKHLDVDAVRVFENKE